MFTAWDPSLDPALLLDVLVTIVAGQGCQLQLKEVPQLHPFLGEKDLAMVTHALVMFRFNN